MWVFMYSTGYSYFIWMELEFSQYIFEKCSNMKFHENPSVVAEFFHEDRWTDVRKDGQTWRSLTVVYRNFADAATLTAHTVFCDTWQKFIRWNPTFVWTGVCISQRGIWRHCCSQFTCIVCFTSKTSHFYEGYGQNKWPWNVERLSNMFM